MPISRATVAKKAVIDILRGQAVPAGLLVAPTGPGVGAAIEPVDVRYGYRGDIGMVGVYGGGWRVEQNDVTEEGPGLLAREVIAMSLYVRVVARPVCDPEETDAIADIVGTAISVVLLANPQPAPGVRVVGFVGGMGDYSSTDDETISNHAYQLRLTANLTWG